MRRLRYDPARYPFREWVASELARRGFGGVELELLHLCMSATQAGELMDRLSRASARGQIRSLLEQFVLEYVSPLFGGEELALEPELDVRALFPRTPEMALPLHTDVMFGHDPAELNVWMPLTAASGTATLHVVEDAGEVSSLSIGELGARFGSRAKAIDALPGEAVVFAAGEVHGSVTNETEHTRVSVDLRVVPAAIARASFGVTRHYRPVVDRSAAHCGDRSPVAAGGLIPFRGKRKTFAP